MLHINNWVCITFWLHAVLSGTGASPQNNPVTSLNAASTFIANAATSEDHSLRTQTKPQEEETAPTTTSPYIPQRLTDRPSTKRRLTNRPKSTYIPQRLTDRWTPQRLTDPPTPSTEPESTTYELSVTPVVISPRKLKSPESMRHDCIEFSIIPDLFNNTPPFPMEVRYLFELVPRFGNALDPRDLIYRPYYVIWPNNKTDYYTLMMLDIDYPHREHPYMKNYQHWLVVNIRGDDWIRADTWSEYIGPNPAFASGFHRYVFLVFKQPSFIHFTDFRYPEMRLDEHRANFSVHKFRRKYNLKPHAMNFFLSQWWSDFVYP